MVEKKRVVGFIWRKERGCTDEKGEKSGVDGPLVSDV